MESHEKARAEAAKEEEKAREKANEQPKKKQLTVEEFDDLKADPQKELLKKLGVEGDVSTEEERIVLYKKFLKV